MTLPELDRWQYRLTPMEAPGAVPLGSKWLEVGEGLPLHPLLDANGQAAGVLLGFPLDIGQRQIVEGAWRAPLALDAGDGDAFVHGVLWALGGRYLAIFVIDGAPHIYPDSGSRIPCVYDHETGFAGSTAAALLAADAYEERFNRALYDNLGVEGQGWFPAGLTAHRGVERLLPGYGLEVETGRFKRFWPAQAPGPVPEPEVPDPEVLVEEIIALVRAQIEAMAGGKKRLAVALTAGHDTRAVLACARPFLANADVVTMVYDGGNSRDAIIAGRITRKLGLHHVKIPRRLATPAQHATFIRRGGHCYADTNSWFHPTVWPLADTHLFIGGLGGECANGFLWKAGDTATAPVTARVLSLRMGLPVVPAVEEALEGWLQSLPALDAFGILDVAYLENRMASWSSVQFCCDPGLVRHDPLMCWAVESRMLALPPGWKQGNRFSEAIIARCWPELGAFPFNSLGVWHDFGLTLRRALGNPRLVMKKLRKMRG